MYAQFTYITVFLSSNLKPVTTVFILFIATEWTQAITRFMREQLHNLNKGNPLPHHAAPSSGWSPQPNRNEALQPGDNVCTLQTMFHQQKHLSRQNVERIVYYVNKLACHMYVEVSGMFMNFSLVFDKPFTGNKSLMCVCGKKKLNSMYF